MKLLKFAQTALMAAGLMAPAAVLAELPGVKIIVKNFSATTGTVEISLFDSAATFMQEPYLQESGTVDASGFFEVEFVALPEGEYAVVVVHDANDNGKLDNGFFGFGSEDYGFSNNVRPWLGRPGFDAVKFRVDRPGVVVEIDLD
jgi:uncharacterized protein (DUF2141 family)